MTPDALALDADPDLMSQVLINLIRNAGRGGAGAAAPHVWLTFDRAADGRTRIEVADNGAGVPEALRQDVFLPFFTTKAEGTGVGLSLARQVVLAHQAARSASAIAPAAAHSSGSSSSWQRCARRSDRRGFDRRPTSPAFGHHLSQQNRPSGIFARVSGP